MKVQGNRVAFSSVMAYACCGLANKFAKTGRYASQVEVGEFMGQPLNQALALFYSLCVCLPTGCLWVVYADLEKVATAWLIHISRAEGCTPYL